MACYYYVPFQGQSSFRNPTVSFSHKFNLLKTTHHLSSSLKPFLREMEQLVLGADVLKVAVKNTTVKLLDAFVDSAFEFVDYSYPLDLSQTIAAPVDELREAVPVTSINGDIPSGFPQGVYIRNGSNPVFGGLKSTKSIFGQSSPLWVEGEGMLHALYFSRDNNGGWTLIYNNRYVETDTFKLEKLRNKPSFLPAVHGDSLAVIFSFLLNLLRFGKPSKNISNTNVFEHSGKLYSIAENDLPQEIDIFTLQALGCWDVNGAWNRPFTAHPKPFFREMEQLVLGVDVLKVAVKNTAVKLLDAFVNSAFEFVDYSYPLDLSHRAPGTGELVTMGTAATKPFVEVGVISADGKELLHKLDLKLDRCPLCHELGVTKRYNVFLDCPITVDVNRLIHGGQLIKYEQEGYARIGVMPRYGHADSIRWFKVKPNCTFHIFNCFEDSDEVVVWGFRALASVIPGPVPGSKGFEWFPANFKPSPGKPMEDAISEDQLLFPRPYEWRLNVRTGYVKERYLAGPNHFPMEFPMINGAFTGVRNKYGYTQVCHYAPSSAAGMGRFGGLAKLYFEDRNTGISSGGNRVEGSIQVEYHMFEKNTYCSGAAFVPKEGGVEEDDGWIITFVHHQDTNISQVYIIDTKNFLKEPVARITLPCRVPDGFHGAFVPIQLQNRITRMIPEI